MNKLWEEYRRDLVYIGIIVVIILLLLRQCNSTADAKREKKIADQNVYALNDSIKVIKNKAGELQYEKGLLIADKKNLESLNADLKKELDKQKGKVFYLQQVVADLRNQPPVYIPTTEYVYPNGDRSFQWAYDTIFSPGNSRALSGESFFVIDTTNNKYKIKPLYTNITKDNMSIKITTGLLKKDDKYEIFVKSDYPGFSISQLDGAFIPTNDKIFGTPPKPKRFGLGVNIGPGIFYNAIKQNIGAGIGVQVGIQYNFINF
jgi:hypothetical protein